MAKAELVETYIAARSAFLQTIEGITDAEADAATGEAGEWTTIKDLVGHVAAWEREFLIDDELIKRGEESHLKHIVIDEFNRAQAEHRRSWTFAQVRQELDLNYEAVLMAWDEYEGEDGPYGEKSWSKEPRGRLWLLPRHLIMHGSEIARRRGKNIEFPPL
jgi:hypothetical protein